jgi:cytokinesis protein
MDDLMSKLRAAKPEARDQRDRRRRARLKERHAVRVASGQEMPELEALVKDDDGADGAKEAAREGGARGDKPGAPLLSPTSDGSDERSAADSDGEELDIADRAASLLQDMGGANDDDERDADADDAAGPDAPAAAARESSLRVRRRREGAAEEERARRRQRRQQARSEASIVGVPAAIAEEAAAGQSQRGSAEVKAGALATPPPDGQGKRPGTPPPGPVTVVSPPTPEAGRKPNKAATE